MTGYATLAFNEADANRAFDEWGCNCGPTALAAAVGLTPDQVRPHMLGFEKKKYTNPTMMFEALDSLAGAGFIARWKSVTFRGIGQGMVTPEFGLARIQWEGPWTAPGVPLRVRYRKTHWVAVNFDKVFDVNAMWCGGWVQYDRWVRDVVPVILRLCVPKANGKWHITHGIPVCRKRLEGAGV